MSIFSPSSKPKQFQYKPRFTDKINPEWSDEEKQQFERERLRRELDFKWKKS